MQKLDFAPVSFHVAGKRRKAMAPVFVAPYRVDAQPTPTRKKKAKDSPFAASSAELDLSRLHSTQRLHEVWADIGARHTAIGRRGETRRGQSRALHENEDDIINLLTLEIEVDRGVLRGTKPGSFAIGTFSLPGGQEGEMGGETQEGEEDSDGSAGDWEELLEGDEDDVMGNWSTAMDGPSILSRLRQRQNEEREDDLRAFLRDEARNQSCAMDEDEDDVVDLTDDFFAAPTNHSSPRPPPRANRPVKYSSNSPRPPPVASSSAPTAYRRTVVEVSDDDNDDELGIIPVASPVVRSVSKPVDRKGKGKETTASPTKLIRHQLEQVGITSPAAKRAPSLGLFPYNASRRASLTTPTTSSPLRRISFPRSPPDTATVSRSASTSSSPFVRRPHQLASNSTPFSRQPQLDADIPDQFSISGRSTLPRSSSAAPRGGSRQEEKENGKSSTDRRRRNDDSPAPRRRAASSKPVDSDWSPLPGSKRTAKPAPRKESPPTSRSATTLPPRRTRASSSRPEYVKQPFQHPSSTARASSTSSPKSTFLRQETPLCDDDDPMQLYAPPVSAPRSRAQSTGVSARKVPTKRASSAFAHRPIIAPTPPAKSRTTAASTPKSAPNRSRSVTATPRSRQPSARASSVFSYQPIFVPSPSSRRIDPGGTNVSDRTRSTSVSPQISLPPPMHRDNRASSVVPVQQFLHRPNTLPGRSNSAIPTPSTQFETPSPNKRSRAATEDVEIIRSPASPRQRAASEAPRTTRGRFSRSVSASPGPGRAEESVGSVKGKERAVSVSASPTKKQKKAPSGISPLRGVLLHRTNFASPFSQNPPADKRIEEDPLHFSPAGTSSRAPSQAPPLAPAVQKIAATISPKYSPSHRSPMTLKRVREVQEAEESDDELSMEF